MTRAELTDAFNSAFGKGLMVKLAHNVHDGYLDAVERSVSVEEPFQKRAIPQLRHFIIQSRVMQVGKNSRRVESTVLHSPTGDEPYVVLVAGNFFLSVSMVKSPGQLPRQSDFRTTNSVHNLFSDFEPRDETERKYAILTHVPLEDNSAPEHLSVIFPNDDYTGVYTAINFNHLIAFDLERRRAPSEDISQPEPRLRRRIPKKKGKEAS